MEIGVGPLPQLFYAACSKTYSRLRYLSAIDVQQMIDIAGKA